MDTLTTYSRYRNQVMGTRVEELESENARLREALESIVQDFEHWENTGRIGERGPVYADTAIAALAGDK